uniref:Uncharacterized protein n=1 Tax=Chorda asiatica TaxID=1281577 RepID=A0A8F0FC10_9PHAE|nr:hypothetical protein [Chorda asiatica]
MRVSFLQLLFLFCLGLLFFADFPQLAKLVKQKIKFFNKRES